MTQATDTPAPPAGNQDPPTLRPGITGWLFLILVAVSLAPLLAVGTWMVQTSVRAVQDATRELQIAVVNDVSRAVRSELQLSRLELETIARILLGDGYGDDDRRLDLASSRLSASDHLDWVAVYTPEGARLGSLRSRDVTNAPADDQLPAFVKAGLERGPLAVGDVYDAGGYPALRIATRIRIDEQLRGYLLAGASLARLSDLTAEISTRRFDGTPDSVYLVDRQLRLIAHPELARAAKLEPRGDRGFLTSVRGDGVFDRPFALAPEFSAPDGERRLGALESIPELGWAVVTELPLTRAYATSARLRRSMWLGAAGSALAMLGVAFVAARRLTRPIRALVDATSRLAARRFDTRVDVRRSDEIGTLARSFNQMAEQLKASEEQLVAETRIRGDLSRYLSPEVVEEIIHHPERMQLGGERRQVTVLFADIVSFTGFSERLEPEVIVSVLNELFTIATEIVLRRGGIIDKFIGDCVMAVFGAPRSAPDDAARAVQAAEDLMRWLEVGNRRWKKAYGLELQLAVGINSGPAVAGNIGSQKRMEYTVIGDTVNVAARLESLARPGQILISEATRSAIGDRFEAQKAGAFQLKGRETATDVYVIDVGA